MSKSREAEREPGQLPPLPNADGEMTITILGRPIPCDAYRPSTLRDAQREAYEAGAADARSQALEEAAQAAERTDAAWCVDTLVGAHIVDAIRALKDQK